MSSDNLEVPYERVTRKSRKTKLKFKSNPVEIPELLTEVEKAKAIRRLEAAKEDIKNSNFFKSITYALKKGLGILDKTSVTEIICLGLGKVGESLTPKYQLAVLLCLSDIYKIEVKVFDPVFTEDDRFILEKFNVSILSENLEGKYTAGLKTTLFFLPHCPKQLTNNILWSNWGLNLSNCILICNSFNRIIEQNSKANLSKGANYILDIISYTEEIIIENSFKFDNIFNDTSLHIFPLGKLTTLPADFWDSCVEPEYKEEDIEFVRRKLSTVGQVIEMAGSSTIRSLISELRHSIPKENLKNNLALQYILGQYRKYQTTDEQLCKAKEEVKFMAETYLCYLRSSRQCQKIHEEFHGKGERTVGETANMVGFKLPHDPK